KDVALNHSQARPFENRILHHGRKSLMDQLVNRYQKYRVSAEQAIPETATELTHKAEQFLGVPQKMKLAPEFSMAE
ncbi:MAG: hypothetical protein WD887_02170, partial [Candidatus Saccharimonadales bacterium]